MKDSDREMVCQAYAEGTVGDVLAWGVTSEDNSDLAIEWAAVLPQVCPSP